ncbi:MAG: Fpg/Nei family DNA glycosylase [Acidimicrobiales bacterium]
MPEGHTIHRLARDLRADLGQHDVGASSPQGRFEAGSALIDGRNLVSSEAWGKHLFLEWDSGDLLHVHLGLIGKFRPTDLDETPSETVRLRLEGQNYAWHLTGPQTCAVVTPDDREEVISRLGPDPLRRGTRRRGVFVERLTATKRPLGAALLDQAIIAGIGNVYRAELLFLQGVNPAVSASRLDEAAAAELWDTTVTQLRRGLEWNRIVTVHRDDLGKRVTRNTDPEDALYVYHRTDEPCRRCQTLVEAREIAGRQIWFCPRCQPEHP